MSNKVPGQLVIGTKVKNGNYLMKQVINIIMSSNGGLHEVETGGFLSINRIDQHEYEILLDGIKIENAYTEDDAKNIMYKFAVYERLKINGYGPYSGREFWELPDELQEEVYKISRGGE